MRTTAFPVAFAVVLAATPVAPPVTPPAAAATAATAGAAAAVAAAAARPPRLRLCTGEPGGIYHFAGAAVAAAARPESVRIEPQPTDGSLANIGSIANGDCDAALVQADAVFAHNADNPGRRLRLAPLIYLHREYVHLICRRDSGVTAIDDLADDPAPYRLLLGPVGSGSHVTWRSFTHLDPDYAPVQAVATDRTAIVEAMVQGRADCLFQVAGLGSEFITAFDGIGAEFRLVAVADGDLDDLELLGNRLYKFSIIPAATYPQLQADIGSVETIAVRALFIVTEDWANAHADGREAVVAAVEAALPAILSRAGEAPDG